jgi:DNA-binding NarL/FixJ family response regulator
MLGERPPDRLAQLRISEAASLQECAAWLPELDLLILAGLSPSLASLPGLLPPEARLAVLLLADDPSLASGLPGLPLRAWGLLPLEATAAELNAAVDALLEGLLVVSPVLARKVAWLAASNPSGASPADPLSQREIEVLQHLAQGLPNKQIALRLGISEHTVKFHVSSIYTKLDATNRTEAVRLGVQLGWITL